MMPTVLAVTSIPLGKAALCLDDECVFPVTDGRCPDCHSETFVLLSRFLERGGSRDCMTAMAEAAMAKEDGHE